MEEKQDLRVLERGVFTMCTIVLVADRNTEQRKVFFAILLGISSDNHAFYILSRLLIRLGSFHPKPKIVSPHHLLEIDCGKLPSAEDAALLVETTLGLLNSKYPSVPEGLQGLFCNFLVLTSEFEIGLDDAAKTFLHDYDRIVVLTDNSGYTLQPENRSLLEKADQIIYLHETPNDLSNSCAVRKKAHHEAELAFQKACQTAKWYASALKAISGWKNYSCYYSPYIMDMIQETVMTGKSVMGIILAMLAREPTLYCIDITWEDEDEVIILNLLKFDCS
jgi:hypothetical protein